MKRISLSLLVCFAAFAPLAHAQTAPTAPYLTVELSGALMVPETAIKEELKLTSVQRSNLTKAISSYASKQQALMKTAKVDDKSYEQLDVDAARQILAVLNAEQKNRLRQITLQIVGAQGLLDTAVATELGLSKEQRNQIAFRLLAIGQKEEDLDAELAKKLETVPRPQTAKGKAAYEKKRVAIAKSFDPQRAELAEKRKYEEGKVLETLTADQRAKWQSMLGVKFDPKQ